MNRFTDALDMDVCDLRPEHLDLFVSEHLKSMAAKSRNHFRSTLTVFFKFCVRKSCFPENHSLRKSQGFRPDDKTKEQTETSEVKLYTAQELHALFAHTACWRRLLQFRHSQTCALLRLFV